jgi:nitroimidazol reductase NimA-like FMN-containing flavoprotein (pyridoxamine 5'-phosphate oxidase superfamily)
MDEEEIINFLARSKTGRLATINVHGFPLVLPLNFIYLNRCIYIHSNPFGEKIKNIINDPKVGFEVDQNIVTLPSYYFYDSSDPSETDTLYRSVVITGYAKVIKTNEEKVVPLQKFMEKYQPEGSHQLVTIQNKGLQYVDIVEIKIHSITGKKKIGQHWSAEKRLHVANQIKKYNKNYQEIFSEIDIRIDESLSVNK